MTSEAEADAAETPPMAGGSQSFRRTALLVALTLFVAATRFFAVSHSMWDWDEGLFCSALHHYDVAAHHPHPPGFPLFIAVAKLVRLFVHDDFHALRGVSLAASLFVFPALYWLARSFRFPFRTSVIAALLFSFLPNVWYWGGTAFSDMLALVLFLVAAALLLRDERRGTYVAGCIFFAATMLIRPQNVLLAWPWIIASWRRWRSRRRTEVIVCALLIVCLVLGGYALAAMKTGWSSYVNATRSHQKYVATVDGSLNPNRTPMRLLFYEFAIDPFLAGVVSKILFLFAIIALIRPRRRHVDVLATFVPNLLLAWFLLNPTGVSRLSLGYIAMNALLAADGMGVIAGFLTSRASAPRRDRLALAIQLFFALILIGRYIFWTWPALREVRKHDSPPVEAMHWIQTHVPRATGKIYVQGGLPPFTDYYLDGYNCVDVGDEVDPAAIPAERDAYYAADHLSAAPQAINFRRPHKTLWALFNRRYFESCIVPISGGTRFVEGWHVIEASEEGDVFRWMAGHSRTLLQPLGRQSEIDLRFYVPLDAEAAPTVTITFDGRVLDRFVPKFPEGEKTYVVNAGSGTPDELIIDVDHVVNPARMHRGTDTRDLGLQLRALSWRAIQ